MGTEGKLSGLARRVHYFRRRPARVVCLLVEKAGSPELQVESRSPPQQA